MARNAPPFKTNRAADRARTFTGAQDLQAVPLCPDFGPQRCVVTGTGAGGVGSATLTTEDGATLTVATVGATPVDVPVTDIVSVTTATVLALWWIIPSKDDQQLGPFPLNPEP